jgi:hypothetical protein
MVAALTRWARASVRTLQCVAPAGLRYRVAFTIASSSSAVSRRLRPGRGASSSSPSTPACSKRLRQRNTVGRLVPSSTATRWLATPSAERNTMRRRSTTFCGVLPARTKPSNSSRSFLLRRRAWAASHMLSTILPISLIVTLLMKHYTSAFANVNSKEQIDHQPQNRRCCRTG